MNQYRWRFISTILLLIATNIELSFAQAKTEKATFAGGCYWCMEEAFERVEGTVSVVSGFTANVEAIEVLYDPEKLPYNKLLQVFWKNTDPTDAEGQFCDRGLRYRSAIFVHNETQQQEAENSKLEIEKLFSKNVATPVLQAVEFKPVAESEQDFYKKKPFEYKQYKVRCGRDRRLRALWK